MAITTSLPRMLWPCGTTVAVRRRDAVLFTPDEPPPRSSRTHCEDRQRSLVLGCRTDDALPTRGTPGCPRQGEGSRHKWGGRRRGPVTARTAPGAVRGPSAAESRCLPDERPGPGRRGRRARAALPRARAELLADHERRTAIMARSADLLFLTGALRSPALHGRGPRRRGRAAGGRRARRARRRSGGDLAGSRQRRRVRARAPDPGLTGRSHERDAAHGTPPGRDGRRRPHRLGPPPMTAAAKATSTVPTAPPARADPRRSACRRTDRERAASSTARSLTRQHRSVVVSRPRTVCSRLRG
jgi:hypothetical protein